jgi:hypothetical protein
MKSFYVGNARNIVLTPNDNGDLAAVVEVILINEKIKWTATSEGLSRGSVTDEHRFHSSPASLRELASQLIEMADDAEELQDRVYKMVEKKGGAK